MPAKKVIHNIEELRALSKVSKEMRYPVTNSEHGALIDSVDFEKVAKHTWFVHSCGYAESSVGGRLNKKKIYMHQVVMFNPTDRENFVFHHKNGDKLDNRKNNLGIRTRSEHCKEHQPHLYHKPDYVSPLMQHNKEKQSAQLLSSASSDDWATDPAIFKTLDDEFHFTLDVNADVTNHKCTMYFTKEQDALKQKWSPHRCFCNPPFSLNKEFVRYGKQQAHEGALVVFLIPARTNVSWFHEQVWDNQLHRVKPGVEIRFYPGRLPYIGSYGDAPFPVMLVVFRPGLPL